MWVIALQLSTFPQGMEDFGIPSPLPGERGRVRGNLDCIVGADVSVGPDS